jgi:hypothetical protein
MELILLGGKSLKNQEWIEKVKYEFRIYFPNSEIIYYDHWNKKEFQEIDLDLEAKKLAECAKTKKYFSIFAKSMGTIITMKAVKEYGLNPVFCVFTGLPVNIINEHPEYLNFINDFSCRSILFQNEKDNMGHYQDAKDFKEKARLINLEVIQDTGQNHEYENFYEYLSFLNNSNLEPTNYKEEFIGRNEYNGIFYSKSSFNKFYYKIKINYDDDGFLKPNFLEKMEFYVDGKLLKFFQHEGIFTGLYLRDMGAFAPIYEDVYLITINDWDSGNLSTRGLTINIAGPVDKPQVTRYETISFQVAIRQ